VNGVVRPVGCGDQVVRIYDPLPTLTNIVRSHGIDVMDQKPTFNLITRDAEITTLISNDHSSTSIAPLTRRVELLVHPAVEAERRLTNFTSKDEVLEPLFERL